MLKRRNIDPDLSDDVMDESSGELLRGNLEDIKVVRQSRW